MKRGQEGLLSAFFHGEASSPSPGERTAFAAPFPGMRKAAGIAGGLGILTASSQRG